MLHSAQKPARDEIVENPVEQIELRAWEERGRPLGTPEIDWYRAEQELSEGTLSKVAREVGSAVGKVVAVFTDAEKN
jgi:hypothetical protein